MKQKQKKYYISKANSSGKSGGSSSTGGGGGGCFQYTTKSIKKITNFFKKYNLEWKKQQ